MLRTTCSFASPKPMMELSGAGQANVGFYPGSLNAR